MCSSMQWRNRFSITVLHQRVNMFSLRLFKCVFALLNWHLWLSTKQTGVCLLIYCKGMQYICEVVQKNLFFPPCPLGGSVHNWPLLVNLKGIFPYGFGNLKKKVHYVFPFWAAWQQIIENIPECLWWETFLKVGWMSVLTKVFLNLKLWLTSHIIQSTVPLKYHVFTDCVPMRPTAGRTTAPTV